jgi:hypothetical protein
MKIYYDAEVDALYLEFRQLEPGTAEPRPLSDDDGSQELMLS